MSLTTAPARALMIALSFSSILTLAPATAEAEVFSCFFAQSCADNGGGCRLESRNIYFDMDRAHDVILRDDGRRDALYIFPEGGIGLLSIFPDDELNPPDQAKYTLHLRPGGPLTFVARSYHGVCAREEE